VNDALVRRRQSNRKEADSDLRQRRSGTQLDDVMASCIMDDSEGGHVSLFHLRFKICFWRHYSVVSRKQEFTELILTITNIRRLLRF